MQPSSILPQEGQTTAAAPSKAVGPLIDGPGAMLWAGAGAIFFIMLLVFFLLMRWRAARRQDNAAAATDFFQPAGEGAEITFEEPAADLAPATTYLGGEQFAPDAPELEAIGGAAEPTKKKSSPFAGLFAKRQKEAPQPAPEEIAATIEILEAPSEDLATVRIERNGAAGAPSISHSVFGSGRAETNDYEEETRRRAAEVERRAREEAEFRRAENEARARAEEDARRRAEEDSRRRIEAEEERQRAERARRYSESAYRAPEPERLRHQDDIVRTLTEVEEALHAQREAIQAETRTLLDGFARRFSERLDALADSMAHRPAQRFADVAGGDHGSEAIARQLADHRREIDRSVAGISSRLDALAAAPDEMNALRGELSALRDLLGGRGGASAPMVQLSDIVRNALPPSAYEFGAVLGNNRKADCLIKLPHPPGPIAIDARFPVEAFQALRQARAGTGPESENDFRRIALRHIVDIAERLIVDGETAESALMFLPSEAMYSEIHARFPDIVQDSYRARVWIVSPTSLMATLHTIRAVLRDADQRQSVDFIHTEAEQVLAEVDQLRQRVSTLEESFERARHDVRNLISSTDQVYLRAETISRTGRSLAEATERPRAPSEIYAPAAPTAAMAPVAPRAYAPAPPSTMTAPRPRPPIETRAIETPQGDLYSERSAEERAPNPPPRPPFPLR